MSEDGYLYLGYDGTGLFKIGITSNPSKRLSQIRVGNPTFTFLWCFMCPSPQVRELQLHTHFSEKRVSGEWFDLIPDDLKYFLQKFITDYEMDYFDLWDRIRNKKIALDKDRMDTVNEYWRSIRRSKNEAV